MIALTETAQFCSSKLLTRVAAQHRMVGAPYGAVKQARYGAQRDRLLQVQYETLTADPAKTMHAIYGFIGEPGLSCRVCRTCSVTIIDGV